MMNDEKFILDATAGFRMMWFNKHEPHMIYLDQRPECEPDIVGDFRDLKQIQDETFRLIFWDPPHSIRSIDKANTFYNTRLYGSLHPESWQHDLRVGFEELWRVLKPYGILLFRWSTMDIDGNDVLALIKVKPLAYQFAEKAKNVYKQRKRIREVHCMWFCFMKFPEAKKE